MIGYLIGLWCLVLPVEADAQLRLPPLRKTVQPSGRLSKKIYPPLRFIARVNFQVPLVHPFDGTIERTVARVQAQPVVPKIYVPVVAHAFSKWGPFPGKERLDAVIFDLDGTLLDSLGAWEHSGSNFVRSRGIVPPPSLDDELVSLSLMDGARLIKQRYGLPDSPEEILAQTLAPIQAHYYHDIMAFPGVPQTLARLKKQGVKMVVATASDGELAEAALKRLGLRDYFEFIITCDEVNSGKSSPAVYQEALKRLGTSRERTLVVEDALHALQTAHAAGFPTAGVEEAHSAGQRTLKQEVSSYYIFSYEGERVFAK